MTLGQQMKRQYQAAGRIGGRQQAGGLPVLLPKVPSALVVWCCRELKKHSGKGFAVICAGLLQSLPTAAGIPSPV